MQKSYRYVQVDKSRHGRTVVYFRKGKGPRHRLPDKIGSKAFLAAYQAALESTPIPHVRDMPKSHPTARKQKVETAMRQAIRAANTRSRSKGYPCTITFDWLLERAESNGFRCELTGIEFYAKSRASCSRDPYGPSLDKVEPSKGYTPENVRIILSCLNTMLSDWGEEIYGQVANSYRYWQRAKKKNSMPAPSKIAPHPDKKPR